MTRVRGSYNPRHVSGWVHGLIEGADPDASHPPHALPQGVIADGANFVATAAGKLAVRGGSRVIQSFHEAGAEGALDRIQLVTPFSPTGAAVIGHHAASSKHYIYRLTSEMAFVSGAEGTSRHDLGWNSATPARPVSAELFEKLFLADDSAFAARQGLTAMDAVGTITTPSFDLDGIVGAPATGPIKARWVAAYNNVLFVGGYDSETGGESPAMVRHSFLGRDPAGAGGFDKDAYNIIGAKGQPVTAAAAGRSILLLAKGHELYRLSGFGRGLPGWQYAVQAVDSTLGFGCANAHALVYAEGHWYGIGEAGPWISDGASVDSLVGLRRASWPKVQHLDRAFVASHPERRVILFGFNMAPVDAGRSATDPYALWVWDMDREVWTTNWKPSADIAFVSAVPLPAGASGTSSAPTATPSALVADHDAATLSAASALSWTNGDPTASTEVWLRTATGGYALYQAVGPGVAALQPTGQSDSLQQFAKVRHIKSGVPSAFTDEVAIYTQLAAPEITGVTALLGGSLFVEYVQHADVNPTPYADLQVERSAAGGPFALAFTEAAMPPGDDSRMDAGLTSGVEYCYRARAHEPGWPAAVEFSAYSATVCETVG